MTVAEMAAHTHGINTRWDGNPTASGGNFLTTTTDFSGVQSGAAGGGQKFSLMQPWTALPLAVRI